MGTNGWPRVGMAAVVAAAALGLAAMVERCSGRCEERAGVYTSADATLACPGGRIEVTQLRDSYGVALRCVCGGR